MNNSVVILYYCGEQAYIPMQELCVAEELSQLGEKVKILPVLEQDDLSDIIANAEAEADVVISWMHRPYVTAQHFPRFAELARRIHRAHYCGGIFATMLGDELCEAIPDLKGVFKGYNLGDIAQTLRMNPLPEGVIEVPGHIELSKYELNFDFIRNIEKLYGLKIRGYMTSFSCPNNCYYCFNNILKKYGMAYTSRTLEQAKDDILRLRRLLGSSEVAVKDLNFFHSDFALKLLHFLKKEGIEFVGNLDVTLTDLNESLVCELSEELEVRELFFGLESFHHQTLHRFNKNEPLEKLDDMIEWLPKYNIRLHGIVLFGFPWQTLESLRAEVETALKYMSSAPNLLIRFSPYMPLPMSELQQKYFPSYFENKDVFEKIRFFDTSKYNERNFIYGNELDQVDSHLFSLVSRNMLLLKETLNKRRGMKYLVARLLGGLYARQMARLHFNWMTRAANYVLYTYEKMKA